MPRPNLTPALIDQAPLDKVCLMVADHYAHDKNSVDGSTLAQLAKRLIRAETTPGGPYKNAQGEIDLSTNLAIGYLFALLGKPLPAVTAFITAARAHLPTNLQKLYDRYQMLGAVTPQTSPPLSNPMYIQARAHLSQLASPLKEQALGFLTRVEQADKTREISHLATLFHNSLLTPPNPAPLLLLGQANIYCWIAYMIYDHILDGEPAAGQLPVANVAMRLALSHYQSLFAPTHRFQQKITTFFTTMDHANAWELAHCRFAIKDQTIRITELPRYGQRSFLARRSCAHALGPLALMQRQPYRAEQIRCVEKGFHHYLIARQLNDDLHDWQADIRAGHSSAVVTHLLRQAQITAGRHTIDALVQVMQTHFWQGSLEAVNALIHRHVTLSVQFFLKSGVIQQDSELLHLVAKQGIIATDSSRKHQHYQAFAATYRSIH